MSSASIRASVVQFFTVPIVPGLPVVTRALEEMQALTADGVSPTSTFGVVHILDEKERRVAGPATIGIRFVDYIIHLQICHAFDGSGPEAMDDLDALVEACKARLRSDPRIGQQPSTVFEASQGADPQIHVMRGQTEFVDGIPTTWLAIEFLVTEQIAA